MFHGRQFVRHLGIYKRVCVELLQLMCVVITLNLLKKTVSMLINGWVTANKGVSRPLFCQPSLNLLSDLCQTLKIMSGVIPRNLKNDVSILDRFPGVHKRGTHTRNTNDDSNRWNAMLCISPKTRRHINHSFKYSLHNNVLISTPIRDGYWKYK